MRKLSADWIFPVSSPPLKRGILIFDNNQRLIDVIDTGGALKELPGLEFFNGILIPGLVNTHCHSELSYLHNVFPMHSGLPEFIRNIIRHKRPPEETIHRAIREADLQMWEKGIQAVGDICNTALSFPVKEKSRIHYHNFVETFDRLGGTTANSWTQALELWNLSQSQNIPCSIVPHAPYTVSPELFVNLNKHSDKYPAPVCIHNLETPSEDEFMVKGTGELGDFLQSAGIKPIPQNFRKASSLQTFLPLLPNPCKILLVHNTFMQKKDLDLLKKENRDVYLSLCPNANLYIENSLPPVLMMLDAGMPICLGTDSLASNTQLSVWDELKTLSCFFPRIPFRELLRMACLNGAKALGMDSLLGSFDVHKKPGVVLVTGIDPKDFKILPGNNVRRIL